MAGETGIQYMVRDGAGNEYGPASLELLRQWAGEGRVTGQMLVGAQGSAAYVAAGQMAELAGAFSPVPGGAGAAGGCAGGPGNGAQRYYGTMPGGLSQGMAIASLACALGGFMFCGVPAILGVIFGHIARAQIRREPERYGGDGMALAGLIVGYIMLVLLVLGVAALILAAATDSLH